jgi:phage terminase large subunit
MKVSLPNDFAFRDYQIPFAEFMDNGGKKAFVVWHRRSGKDLTALHQTCKLAHQRKGAYWHLFPTFAQARKAIWEGFTKDGKRTLENVFPGFLDPKRAGSIVKRKDEQQMVVELKCGSIWRLLGSDRVEVVGAGPVGVVYSEYAICSPRSTNLISPMLRENDGWEVYITTPRGSNHARDLYDRAKADPKNWYCDIKTLYDTRAYDPEETIAAERASGKPEAFIKQEYLCDWTAALVGSVWGDLIDGIEKEGGLAPFDHEHGDVFTSWDLGFTDSTAIWFWQVKGGRIDFIDYYENHGKPLSHYYDVVDGKPYRYVKHWLPHDARQTTLAAGVSILNQFLRKYPGVVSVGPDLPLLEGIQAARWMMQKGVRFHPRTTDGVKCLREYHYEYDEDKKDYSTRPSHDWSSHAADAMRYSAAVVKVSEMMGSKPAPAPPKPLAAPLHHQFTLDQLHADREQSLSRRLRIA